MDVPDIDNHQNKMVDRKQIKTIYRKFIYGATLNQEELEIALQEDARVKEERKAMQNNQNKGQLMEDKKEKMRQHDA